MVLANHLHATRHIEIFEWNPRRGNGLVGRVGSKVGLGRRVNNFGDRMGGFIIREMCRHLRLTYGSGPRRSRMLSVGSVLHFARAGDVVWGSGVNGKVLDADYSLSNVDVRAVRGPLTREFLMARDVEVPEVYGDPALLLSQFYTRLELSAGQVRRAVTIVPNLNDYGSLDADDERIILPTLPIMKCISSIAASDLVVGSSLHAIIIAESLGVPARLVASPSEPRFKYEDYYLGSGRQGFTPAGSVLAAIQAGGEKPPLWNSSPLYHAFPRELFGSLSQ